MSLDTFKEERSAHKLQAAVSPVSGLTRACAPNPSCLLSCDVQEESGNGSQVQLTWQDSSLILYSFLEPCYHPLSGPHRNTEANTPHWEVTPGGCLWVHVCFRMKCGGGAESHVSQTPMPPTQVLAHCPLSPVAPQSLILAASTDTSASLFPTNPEFVSPTLLAEALSPPVTHRCSGGRRRILLSRL